VTGISQKGKRTYLTDRHEKTSTLTGISQKGKRTYLTDRVLLPFCDIPVTVDVFSCLSVRYVLLPFCDIPVTVDVFSCLSVRYVLLPFCDIPVTVDVFSEWHEKISHIISQKAKRKYLTEWHEKRYPGIA
jgi:phage gp36-like protein